MKLTYGSVYTVFTTVANKFHIAPTCPQISADKDSATKCRRFSRQRFHQVVLLADACQVTVSFYIFAMSEYTKDLYL